MSAADGPTDNSRTHIQTFWTPWDSCVNVPDYPVRILPAAGVEQLVQWYSLLAEMQKHVEPATASQRAK
jgi:hypothetical protein